MIERRIDSDGYVLFLVAAVIALLSIVLITTARVQSGLSRPLHDLRIAAARDVTVQSIGARLAFLALTEPLGARSILVGGARVGASQSAQLLDEGVVSVSGERVRELRLDGRPNAVESDGVFVSVQDENGLMNLNAGDDIALGNLIGNTGVSRRTARALAAALNDYVDEDDLARPYGAEKGSYLRAGLPAPVNRPLRSPWEAASAYNWRSLLSERQRAEIWRLGSAPAVGKTLNVNTAPAPVLEAILGDARLARTLIARREQSPLLSLTDVEGLTGARTRADGVVLATRPGSTLRIAVAFGDAPEATRERIESQLEFAGEGADRPIYWGNVRRARTPGGAWEGRDRGEGVERLPEIPALLAP